MDFKEIVKKIGWSTVLQLNSLVIAPAFSIFLARLYNPDSFSKYFLSYVLLNIFSIPLSAVLVKNISYYQVRNLRELKTYDAVFIASSFVLVTVYLLSHLVYAYFGLDFFKITLLLFPTILLLRGLKALPNGMIDRDGDFKRRAIINGLSGLASMAICILLVIAGSTSGIIILCINLFLAEAISCFFYRKDLTKILYANSAKQDDVRLKARKKDSLGLLSKHKKYLIFNLKNQSIYQVSSLADRFLINVFSVGAAAGAYTKFINFSMILPKTVSGIINRVNYSLLVQKQINQNKENILFLVSGFLLFAGALILTLFTEPIIQLSLGEQWLEHINYLRWAIPIAFLFGINAFMNNHFVAKGNGKIVINRAIIVNTIRLTGLALIFYQGANIKHILILLLGVQFFNFFIYSFHWKNWLLLSIVFLLASILTYLAYYG